MTQGFLPIKLATSNHPSGVYGTDHPGLSFDRTKLCRGWSYPRQVINGWDAPVALSWLIPRSMLKLCGLLRTGTIYCKKAPRHVRIPMLHPSPAWPWDAKIWIHKEIYKRFNLLEDLWHQLKVGELVVCRAPRTFPERLYNSGNCAPMTCGRWVPVTDAVNLGWKLAQGTNINS